MQQAGACGGVGGALLAGCGFGESGLHRRGVEQAAASMATSTLASAARTAGSNRESKRSGDCGANYLGNEKMKVTDDPRKVIFLKPGDVNYRTALATRPGEGEFLIIGHGNLSAQTMAGMTGAQMAGYIADNTPWESGLTVRVDACWLGCSVNGFAQQLADGLNTTVIASPVRTLDIGGASIPMHSCAISFSRALPLWPACWRIFTPAGWGCQ